MTTLKSQFVISRWGGIRVPPYAFTEQGVAMLSSVLHSERAIAVNIEVRQGCPTVSSTPSANPNGIQIHQPRVVPRCGTTLGNRPHKFINAEGVASCIRSI